MKIILSRKGFDKANGHGVSPHIVEDGQLYSFPIPSKGNHYTYNDLRFNDELSCGELMRQLGFTDRACARACHTDPDIRRDMFYSPEPLWRPMLGQQGNPQKHLNKQGIGEGDIFLFYGLFQDVEKVGDRYQYVSSSLRHIIWGYLQVGQPPQHISDNREGRLHPHYYAWEQYDPKDQNTVYIAADHLSFAPEKPGYGALSFHPDRVLSWQAGSVPEIYGIFSLPEFFYEVRMTGNPMENRWRKEGGRCLLRAAYPGQEFVIRECPEASDWAKNLLEVS